MAHAHPGDSNVKSRVLLPPRRRTFSRKFWIFLFAVIAIPLGLLTYSEARFRHEISVRHSKGKRVLAEDFRPPPLPDEQNAAIPLMHAAELIHINGVQDWWLDHVYCRPLVDVQKDFAKQFLTQHQDVIQLVREARRRPKAEWQINLQIPLREHLSLKHRHGQWNLAWMLHLIAIYQHEIGDDHNCLETVRDLLTISRALSQQPYDLEASWSQWWACDIIYRISPTLHVTASAGGTAATYQQLRETADYLLDEPRHRATIAAYWEFQTACDSDWLVHGPPEDKLERWMIERAGHWEVVAFLKPYDTPAKALACDNWPAAKNLLDHAPQPHMTLPLGDHADYFQRLVNRQMRFAVERRIAATSLVLCLYRADHGRWPATLSELSPEYLRDLPRDTFAAGGRPVGYVSAEPPTLYSVAEDGIDGHGDSAGALERGTFDPWKSPDRVVRLGYLPLTTDWDPWNPPRWPVGVVAGTKKVTENKTPAHP